MMISPVEQAVGHAAYFRLQLAGYLVFAAAWCFIAAAVMQFLLELLDEESEERASAKVARGSGSGIATVADYGQHDRISPVSAIPPAAAPVPALSARVLVFAPRKTRNRVVVR